MNVPQVIEVEDSSIAVHPNSKVFGASPAVERVIFGVQAVPAPIETVTVKSSGNPTIEDTQEVE